MKRPLTSLLKSIPPQTVLKADLSSTSDLVKACLLVCAFPKQINIRVRSRFAPARNFNFTGRKWLEFRWETFNLANTPQFGLPATNISSSGNVGRITTLAGDQRVMQFALKLVF